MSKQTAANLRAEWRIFYFARKKKKKKKSETERPAFYFAFHGLNQRHVEESPSSLDPGFVLNFILIGITSSYSARWFGLPVTLQRTSQVAQVEELKHRMGCGYEKATEQLGIASTEGLWGGLWKPNV